MSSTPALLSLGPVTGKERINSMDVMRGISLLGILLMNITGFGLPNAYADPTNWGGSSGWNLKSWWADAMFFEGTMRGMFSMLFGAGIVIFMSRSTTPTGDIRVANAFFRRLLWLFLFGIIHAYILLWDGEILYPYALIGMFAFSFRGWKPKYLVMGAFFLLLCSTALSVKDYLKDKGTYTKYITAKTKKGNGQSLEKKDSTAIDAWKQLTERRKPSKEKSEEDIAEYNKDYISLVWYKATVNQFMQTFVMYRYFFWDILSMMLLGMAFFKTGIIKAERSNRFYILMMVVGYAIGLSVNYFETRHVISSHFSIMSQSLTDITYDFGRVFTTFGHVGLIMLFIKSGILGFFRRSLAAVGQMAFSNYIMHTIICDIIFLGIGFGFYGKLQRYELYYVVFGIWIFQLIASPLWLKYFNFGPLEWGWRSLTYWKKQPFKK
jgi:uncharacterized protein